MRTIFPNEKPYINKLLDAKKEADFSGLQCITFIREHLGLTAIARGNDESKEYIISYIPTERGIQFTHKAYISLIIGKTFDQQTYLQLVDILSLFKELEKNDYVFFSRVNNNGEPFYNRERYDNLKELKNNQATITQKKELGQDVTTIDLVGYKFYGGIAKLFDEYSTAIMFPSNSLDDLASNDFVDIEQRNINQQMKWTRRSVYIAAGAILISAIITLISTYYSPHSKIDSEQVEVIENAIIKSKDVFPTQIEVILPDTITVKNKG